MFYSSSEQVWSGETILPPGWYWADKTGLLFGPYYSEAEAYASSIA